MTDLLVTIDGEVTCDQIAKVLSRGGLRAEAFDISEADSAHNRSDNE